MLLVLVGGWPLLGDARAQEADKPLPKPTDSVLETSDGVRLATTYFASNRGKEAVPVIALHGAGGSRKDLTVLAEYLQKNHGCAVIVPDLRGHGESTSGKDPIKNTTIKLTAASMPLTQYPKMVEIDCERVKSFLMEQHNKGELNIDRLVIIGADMGAVVAALFAARDWSWPPLVASKQGQDVKGLVLLSPEFSYKSLKIQEALAQPGVQKEVSVFIACGADDRASASDAQRINQALDVHRKANKQSEELTLIYDKSLKTKLQGVKLLTEPVFQLNQKIGKFIELRAEKLPLEWKERRNPLGQ